MEAAAHVRGPRPLDDLLNVPADGLRGYSSAAARPPGDCRGPAGARESEQPVFLEQKGDWWRHIGLVALQVGPPSSLRGAPQR